MSMSILLTSWFSNYFKWTLVIYTINKKISCFVILFIFTFFTKISYDKWLFLFFSSFEFFSSTKGSVENLIIPAITVITKTLKNP